MRSAIGPFLVVLALATTVVLVLLLVQIMSLRSDLGRAEERVAALQADVDTLQPGATLDELERELEELRTWTRDWLIATGDDGASDGDVGSPAGEPPEDAGSEDPGSGDPGSEDAGANGTAFEDLVRRLDLVLERITALDERVDEICEGVPVC